MGVTTRRNTSENHNKKRRNHNKKCRKQDSELRNQNGKLKSTPLKPLTLQNRYARAFCASENINKHLQEHQKDYVVTSLRLLRVRGSTIFETFEAQNAEICTPPRPCLPANWNLERPKHGRGGARFSRRSRLKMPKSVLEREYCCSPKLRSRRSISEVTT